MANTKITTNVIADDAVTSAKLDTNIAIAGTLGVTGNITGTLATAAQPNITSVGTLTSFRSTGIDDNADATAITIDSSERVGIGTTSPTRKLSILGTGSEYINIVGGTSSGVGLLLGDSDAEIRGALIYDNATDALGFRTGGNTERMRIDSSGNVGIGATPSSTIRNDISSAEKALQIGNRAMFFSDGGVTTDLQNNSHLNNSDARVAMQTDAGSLYQQYQGVHKWFNAASVSAGATQTMTERMRIDSSGNVGIGTSSPSAKCHLYTSTSNAINLGIQNSQRYWKIETVSEKLSIADVSAGGLARMTFDTSGKVIIGDTASHVDDLLQIETPASGGGHGIQIRRNDSNGAQGIGRIMFGNNNDTDLATIASITDGQADCARLVFSTQPTSGNSTERMRIDSSGNVGIGATSLSKLGLTGTGGLLHLGGTQSQIRLANSVLHHDNSGNTILHLRNHYGATSNYARTKIESGFTTFHTGTSFAERMRVHAGGEVSIGNQAVIGSGSKTYLSVGDGSNNATLTIYTGSSNYGYLNFVTQTLNYF